MNIDVSEEPQLQNALPDQATNDTLFFDDGTSLEINKTKFRGTRRPHAGDLFKLTEKSLPDGKTESRMFLNGNEVKGQLL